ncbi:peptidyl-prolyl cis-trans isomerase A (cyclophilin A) [Sphingomonas jinjuensis]|uniref:peptidylprolyl isomerase n=1 Tax=Sphingomonas jinjuensis TaxID=535907 RepID=A0A840FAH5_9SPHN|nr:peptidylprolyl isomerase [Sphingomonas jinjuensis]MBB4155030.1 peptidyl-prolyl cis-trans isomerase A (cyclophilin A) [Sphingomonas jinjuensis]
MRQTLTALLLATLSLGSPAAAQTLAPTPAPVATPQPGEVRVVLTTSAGPMTIAVDPVHAPLTAKNFLRYVDARRLDGTIFYRAMKLGDGAGLIQGGVQNDPKRLYPPVAHEPTTLTGLSNRDFAISMARDVPGNATADFFISVGDLTSLDAKPGDPGFAVFGRVVDGTDTVRSILGMPTTATARNPAMNGQMLAEPVKILTARRAVPS